MSYIRYADFDAAYGFAEKAGFQLTEVQVKDVETFVGWGSALNSYSVGGGKTCVSTAVALMRGHKHKLVVVPPILILQWAKWLKQVSGSVCIYKGTPAERKKLRENDYQWYVMSHSILRMDFSWVIEKFKEDVEVICDEAHALKSSGSKLFKEVQLLSNRGHVQCLTGTPVSSPMDCYAYVKLLTPDVYRSLGQFETIHVASRNFFKQVTGWQELGLMTSNFNLRNISRTKEELHNYDLKPLFPDSSYTLDVEHMRLYEKLLDEQLLVFDSGEKIDCTSVSKLYHAMQQVIMNFGYFAGDASKRSAGLDLLDLVIEQTQCAKVANSKLLVWCKYRMTSKLLLDYCNSLGIKTVAAYGDSNAAEAVRLFMEDSQTRILIGQPQSCGAGLNCQEVCHEALFMELDTTSLLTRQCVGRVDRIGQLHKPVIRFAVAKGTVQESLLANLLKNDSLVAQIEYTKKGLREMLLGR